MIYVKFDETIIYMEEIKRMQKWYNETIQDLDSLPEGRLQRLLQRQERELRMATKTLEINAEHKKQAEILIKLLKEKLQC